MFFLKITCINRHKKNHEEEDNNNPAGPKQQFSEHQKPSLDSYKKNAQKTKQWKNYI